MFALKANVMMTSGKVRVQGEAHLTEIPPYKNVIIVTTHISDIDVPATALIMGRYFDIAISNISTQHSLLTSWRDPFIYIGLRIAGIKNFLPITYRYESNSFNAKVRGVFNPDDFEVMRNALYAGKAVIISGHNPSKQWKLSRGGCGAAYLAEITENAIMVPVTVNVKKYVLPDDLRKEGTLVSILERPDVDVYVGKPFEIQRTDGVEELAHRIYRTESGESPERAANLDRLHALLKKESDTIMRKLAEPLPENKRGPYAAKLV
jgi:1-acyl-sn-glycerol-3-phosphate acyltransferase